MRLHSLVPTIPSDLVAALEDCGIRTDTDLLFSGTTIEVLKKLAPGVVSFADLEKYTRLVAENASAPGIRGDKVYAEVLRRRDEDAIDLVTGVTELDALVGGFGDSRVFEISGDKSSGKTALALQVALRLLVTHTQASVLWLDTAGDFSAERTTQITQQLGGEGSATALERLRVSLVLNIETADAVLEDLRCSLAASSASGSRVHLVVIDSVTPLLAPSLSAVSSHGHAIMTTFMQHVRVLARTYSLTFLIINNTSASAPYNPSSAFSSTTRKPALGPSFTFLTDCTLWLGNCEEVHEGAEVGSTIHVAEVFRSRTTRSRTWCVFKIQRGLLHSAG
ncbi:P-loop containing nucleoside triphosphate hydrolase protein [Melanogaster broomeanus]|nr:P-loop containing nucleoside triphosphate hydrolase protein [Melanogaster broomeanus]